MSTRGSVAWMENGKVVGVYQHWDSYPTGLGQEVWKKAHEHGVQNLINMLRPYGDWRQLETGSVCEYCGKVTGQPCSISGVLFIHKTGGEPDEDEKKILANKEKTGFPDQAALHHSHTDNRKSDPFQDPLFMEWVYVLDPIGSWLEVWKSVPDSDKNPIRECSGIVDSSGYTHVRVARLCVLEHEPSWEKIEKPMLDAAYAQGKGDK